VHVTLAGSPDRVEAQLVPDAGYEFDTFRITGLPRRPSPALARAVLLAGRAPRACARILAQRRPHVVLGGGGYVAGPMVYAAWRLRIPTALTEADAHLGLANRLSARFARRVFLSYDIASRRGPRYRVVGRPIPAKAQPWQRAAAREELGLPADGPVLLVAGALAGARALNEFAVDTYGASGPAVLHVSGERDYEALRGRVSRPDYKLVPSLDGLGVAYGAADLALTRSGSTVWELAAAGLPSILVPYPFATGNHQTLNARYFEHGGGAVVVPESELARVPDLVRDVLGDEGRRARMSASMRALAKPDAAKEIAEELIELGRSARR
jgi:UDP-N-acetylglucosamine--N-acetylmuramyl-(pentapeptide) pyrophosphoryl-undecaprenol N-acetylglucosamine transferase